jgi:hypothetical protein
MGAAFAHRWEPPLRGSGPPHRLTKGPVQKTQTTSVCGEAGGGAMRDRLLGGRSGSGFMYGLH